MNLIERRLEAECAFAHALALWEFDGNRRAAIACIQKAMSYWAKRKVKDHCLKVARNKAARWRKNPA